MTRICQVPWARMDHVRAQHDVLLGNADLRADPGRRISPPRGVTLEVFDSLPTSGGWPS